MINWLFFSSATLSICTFFLIIILSIYGTEKIHKIWLLFNFFVFCWSINATLTSVIKDYSFSDIFYRIGCVGATFIAPTLVYFTSLLTEKKNNFVIILIYLQAVLFSYLIINSDSILSILKNDFILFTIPTHSKYFIIWFISWFLLIVYAHTLLIYFALKNKMSQKLYLKYFIISSLIGCLSGTLNFLLPFGFKIGQFGNVGVIVYCFLMTYAIFRHQMLGIEIVYRKGLIYSILLGTLTGIYFILIYIAERFFRVFLGYNSLIISLISAFTIAALFNPLRDKIQSLIDRLFLGRTTVEIANENELLKDELERSERIKAAGNLALGLAHEIRNPLTTIKTFAEFLPKQYKDEDFVKKFSELIPSEVERINGIIGQLLNFSKPTLPSFKDINIHQLIRDIIGFLDSEFLKKKIRVSENYIEKSFIVNVDPNQIRQAFLNVIINAIEAMPNGGTITIKTETLMDKYLKIIISDTGCGIRNEDLTHIYDPFYSKKDEGTGLGLTITHRIITTHKGKIEVKSELGSGTTFSITLPLISMNAELSEDLS